MVPILLLFLLFLAGSVAPEGYDNFKIYEVTARDPAQLDVLRQFYGKQSDLEFLSRVRQPGQGVRVLLSPTFERQFLRYLKTKQIDYELLNNDVGNMLREEFDAHRLLQQLRPTAAGERLGTDRYHNFQDIVQHMEALKTRYPERVFLKQVGKSHERRRVHTITITNGDARPNKNVIFVDGGFHSSEWISPAFALYMIDELVENFEDNAHLLEDYDWVILPVVNPDGYEYTQSLPERRFWRKTRRPNGNDWDEDLCSGIDLNRNFDFHWMEAGASDDPCSRFFAGPRPFSEPEAQIVRDILLTLRQRGKMYLTLHSYGSMILYPWAYDALLPEDHSDLQEVAFIGADTIYNATRTSYTVGSSGSALYPAAGSSADYAYHLGFPLAFTMELPRGGDAGFNLPPARIDAVVKEAWIGVRAMALKVIQKFPTERMDFL